VCGCPINDESIKLTLVLVPEFPDVRQLVLDSHLKEIDLLCCLGGAWYQAGLAAHLGDVWVVVEEEAQENAG
jgi:hypothetical protein